mgnify:CR=1 FL=1
MTPNLTVVLVEPAGPLNVGSVARLCANFGVAELRLVAPRCDHLGDEARRMAVHGAWVLEQARLFPNLSAALADCRRVVATSGRRAGERDDRDDEIARLKSKVGEITMDNELLYAKIEALEGKRPLARRRPRR